MPSELQRRIGDSGAKRLPESALLDKREVPASKNEAGISSLAEDRGFEPLRAFTQPAFQASALGHYANPPRMRLPVAPRFLPIGMAP